MDLLFKFDYMRSHNRRLALQLLSAINSVTGTTGSQNPVVTTGMIQRFYVLGSGLLRVHFVKNK